MTEIFRQHQPIEILLANGDRLLAELSIWDRDETDSVRLDLAFSEQIITKRADTYFEAMQLIRQDLEPQDMLLICYGASLNVYPSPMILDMGDGEIAYKLELGKDAKQINLVSIFDMGSDVIPATVAEQNDFYQRWLSS